MNFGEDLGGLGEGGGKNTSVTERSLDMHGVEFLDLRVEGGYSEEYCGGRARGLLMKVRVSSQGIKNFHLKLKNFKNFTARKKFALQPSRAGWKYKKKKQTGVRGT